MRDAWPDNTTTGQTNMPIPYHHDRERSAGILRLAIGLMGRQKAGFHPTSYTIWYEHVAGVNPPAKATGRNCVRCADHA
jgi:hypothetical protein